MTQVLVACSEPPTQAWTPPRGAHEVVAGLTTYMSHEGKRTLLLEADSAFFVNDSAVIHILGADGSFLDERSLVRSRITADSAVLHEDSSVLVLRGLVALFDPSTSFRVEAGELVYDARTNRLRSDSTVTVWDTGAERSGPCFESAPELDDWTFCSR